MYFFQFFPLPCPSPKRTVRYISHRSAAAGAKYETESSMLRTALPAVNWHRPRFKRPEIKNDTRTVSETPHRVIDNRFRVRSLSAYTRKSILPIRIHNNPIDLSPNHQRRPQRTNSVQTIFTILALIVWK